MGRYISYDIFYFTFTCRWAMGRYISYDIFYFTLTCR